MATAAERQKRYRQRIRERKVVARVEIDERGIEVLIREGLLDKARAHDVAAIEAALAKATLAIFRDA